MAPSIIQISFAYRRNGWRLLSYKINFKSDRWIPFPL
jgi:hypothetical protein